MIARACSAKKGMVSFMRHSIGPRSSSCVLDWRFESTDGVLSLEA
jgi:hypothetical protein